MLKDLFDSIVKQSVEAASPKPITIPGIQDKAYVPLAGELKEYRLPPPYRKHTAYSLQPVIDFAGWWNDPEVWYSAKGVIALGNDRRDRIDLDFDESEQVLFLESPSYQKQEQFIKTLKHTFYGAQSENALIDIVRRVKFRTGATGEAEYSVAKRSVGKSLEQEITGAGAIPDYVVFTIPFLTNPTINSAVKVQCSLDVAHDSEAFLLKPLPGELEKGWQQVESRIVEVLSASLPERPIYHGVP